MIVKTLSRRSNAGQLANYIFRYMLRDTEKSLKSSTDRPSLILRHNIRSRSVKGFIREFEENEKFRLVHRKDSVKIFHTILSFSNKDKQHISDGMLKDIFRKFVEERGVNNLYAGAKHDDKDHVHLHLAVSGTGLNGRSSRLSKQQLHHLKLQLDRYQKEHYPELIHSLPAHGKSRVMTKEDVVKTVKAQRQTTKESLLRSLDTSYAKSTSKGDFLAHLKEAGHEPYYRNDNLQGIMVAGKKFRLSRLGFDDARLQELDHQKITEEKELAGMKMLREQNKEIRKEIIKPDINKSITEKGLDPKEQKDLNELVAIRSRNKDLEKKRDIAPEKVEIKSDDSPTSFQESVSSLTALRNSGRSISHEIE